MTKTKAKKYIQAKGRRKSSIARTRLFLGHGEIIVNEMTLEAYFLDVFGAPQKIKGILKKAGVENKIDLNFKVSGGGKNSQVGAVIHSLARALLEKDPRLRKTFRDEGYLTRDPRMKERKKYGLKGARRAPQWAKR